MGIETKSIGALIDELSVTNIRCWFAQEEVMKGGSDAHIAAASIRAQTTNARRNQLMRAIDDYFDDENILAAKSYDPEPEETPSENRVKELESILEALADEVLHPTDTAKSRTLANYAIGVLEKKP